MDDKLQICPSFRNKDAAFTILASISDSTFPSHDTVLPGYVNFCTVSSCDASMLTFKFISVFPILLTFDFSEFIQPS